MHTRPKDLADMVIADAMNAARSRNRIYVFEDVTLPGGWSATIACDSAGVVDSYMAVSPDGLTCITPHTMHGPDAGFGTGTDVGAQVVQWCASLQNIPSAHEAHRAKRRGRARLLAAVETPISDDDVNAMLRHLAENSRTDAAIAGQTQELIRRCVECDCTNETSADADWKDSQ